MAAQNRGRRVHTAHFVLVVASGPDPSAPSRLGITVTRKVGGAVQRNRIKRIVREAFRLSPDRLPHGVDLVVIAKPGAHELGLADVMAEWDSVRGLLERRAREVLASAAAPEQARRLTASARVSKDESR